MKNKIKLIATLLMMYSTIQAQDKETIAVKYYGKPIVKIVLNGVNTWMLLDTGSDLTIIDSSTKDRYNFQSYASDDSRLSVPGFGSKNNQLESTSNTAIEFGHQELEGTVYAFDLSTISQSIHRRTGKRIAGIIGTSMMRKHGFILDMGNSTASITVKRKRNKRVRSTLHTEELMAKSNHIVNQ